MERSRLVAAEHEQLRMGQRVSARLHERAGGSRVWLRPPGRYYLVVDALVHGWAATYDTTTWELVPIRLKGELPRRR